MAMVRQLTEGEIKVESSSEDIQGEQKSEGSNGRPSSQCSSGSKRSSPIVLPSHQYSKEDLMKFSSYPLSQNWPSCLDPAYNNPTGKWDPDRWFMNHRSDRVPPLEETRLKRERPDDGIVSHKRKTSDPKERIKDEKDDIVLSPQRRSFGTGCHVIQQSSLARRPGSPLDRDSDSFREPSRRIGSGRIMSRDREQRDCWDRDREYGYGNNRNDRRDRFDQDEPEKDVRRYSNRFNRNDRRSRGRDRIDEVEPEWFSGGPTSQSETIELVGFEESQNDDENRKMSKKSKKAKQNSRRSSLKSDESEKVENSTSEKVPAKVPPRQGTPKPTEEAKPTEAEDGNDSKPAGSGFDLDDLFRMEWIPGLLPNEAPPDENNEMGCSRFSQWFRRDSPLLGLQESTNNSRKSSLHEELIANVLNSIGEPQLLIPSPTQNVSDNFFAPISPATHSSHYVSQTKTNVSSSKSIMEMLHSASANSDATINGENSKNIGNKFKTVEELEADLKRIVLGDNKKQEEPSAFDKLLLHMADAQNAPPTSMSIGPLDKSKALQEQDLLQTILRPPQPPSPSPVLQFQMFKDEKPSMQPPPAVAHPQFIQPPTQPQQKDILAHMLQQKQDQHFQAQQMHQMQQHQQFQQLQQQQQAQPAPQGMNVQGFTVDMLAKILGTPAQPPLSPASPGLHQPPATQAFNRNEPQVLNSMLQYQRQRELLSSILKQQQQINQNMLQPSQQPRRCPSAKEIAVQQQSLGLPTLGISPRQSPLPPEALGPALTSQGRIPSPLVFGQQPPALSHAPAPIHPAHLAQAMAQNAANPNTLQIQNPVLQRVPSPQELAVHTQTILQNALIKRKLEEQKENFRKRTNSPVAPNKNGMTTSPHKGLSPTLAFTPTSVMRKMQSERVENKESKTPVNINGSKAPGPVEGRPNDPSQNACKPCGTGASAYSTDSNFAVGRVPPPQNRPANSLVQGQGRPIVKGAADNRGNVAAQKPTNKQFVAGSNQTQANCWDTWEGESDSGDKVPWSFQLASQRKPNPPAMATAYALGHRPTPINRHHANLLRPVSVAPAPNVPPSNISFPLFRNMMQNPAIRGQLAALQMRGAFDACQMQALVQSQQHPWQQLLMKSRNPVAAAQVQVAGGLASGRDAKQQHLLPGQSVSSRQSPVNLTKWFGNDVLKQKMPEMPPASHPKALLVEEIERQQQQ